MLMTYWLSPHALWPMDLLDARNWYSRGALLAMCARQLCDLWDSSSSALIGVCKLGVPAGHFFLHLDYMKSLGGAVRVRREWVSERWRPPCVVYRETYFHHTFARRGAYYKENNVMHQERTTYESQLDAPDNRHCTDGNQLVAWFYVYALTTLYIRNGYTRKRFLIASRLLLYKTRWTMNYMCRFVLLMFSDEKWFSHFIICIPLAAANQGWPHVFFSWTGLTSTITVFST